MADTEAEEANRGFSREFLGAVCDRVRRTGTISPRDVAAVLAAARDENALRAAVVQEEDVPDIAPALALLRQRGFSQTAQMFEDVIATLRHDLAEARSALVAAEARAASEPAPLGNDEFHEWWNSAGQELLIDVSLHDAALIFHAGADFAARHRSSGLEQWMVRAAMRIALPYLEKAASQVSIQERSTARMPFERVEFAANAFRQALGASDELLEVAEPLAAMETSTEPAPTKSRLTAGQRTMRPSLWRLFPSEAG